MEPKKFSHCHKSSRTKNRFLNLGIQQRDLEHPGNLTLKSSGTWLENLYRTGETDSWRAQTKLWMYQDPGERSIDPTRGWARLVCQCPGVSSSLPWGRGTDYSSPMSSGVLAKVLLREAAITPTVLWPEAKLQGGNTAPPITVSGVLPPKYFWGLFQDSWRILSLPSFMDLLPWPRAWP